MYHHLKFRKVWARWLPRELKDREKIKRKGIFLQHLFYGMQMKDEICLALLLLGTKYGCITTNPNQSVLKCKRNNPVKLKVTPSAGKIMLTVFWDSQGILLIHFSSVVKM
jgi:hypothetical protein